MRDIRDSNKKILESYDSILNGPEKLNEATKGFRRKVQVLEDKIDDFMDDLEKMIDKEEDNPTFQQKMYQLLANTTKEQSEHIAALKRVAMAIDSGAKVIPQERGQMNFKPNASNVVNQPAEEPQAQPGQPAVPDQEAAPLAEASMIKGDVHVYSAGQNQKGVVFSSKGSSVAITFNGDWPKEGKSAKYKANASGILG